MTGANPWHLSVDGALWDVLWRTSTWDHIICAAYFDRAVAEKEADRLRKKYPRAVFAVGVSRCRI